MSNIENCTNQGETNSCKNVPDDGSVKANENKTIESNLKTTVEDLNKLTIEADNAPTTASGTTTTVPNFYLIKWIEFNCENLPILLQNANGPCPLLAIFNVLLLRKRVCHFSDT